VLPNYKTKIQIGVNVWLIPLGIVIRVIRIVTRVVGSVEEELGIIVVSIPVMSIMPTTMPTISLVPRPIISLVPRPTISLVPRPIISLVPRPIISLVPRPTMRVAG
jgi:hypothetical protein